MADRSLYNDRANSATTRSKRDLALTQISTGAEDSKPATLEVALASTLDKTGSVEATTLARRYNSLTMNPYRAQTVASNAANNKAFNYPTRLGVNEGVAVNLSGAKSATSKLLTGNAANTTSLHFSFYHRTPSVGTARVIFNQILKADSSVTKQVGTLTGNSLVLKHFATVADADTTTGVTMSTRTLIVGKKYDYIIAFGGTTSASGGTVALYENGILIYSASGLTFHAEYIASIAAGLKIQGALEEAWDTLEITNFTMNYNDARIFNNYGHSEIFVVPEYYKWGANSEKVTNGNFSAGSGNTFTGWTASVSGSSTIVEDATGGVSSSRCPKFMIVGSALAEFFQNSILTVGKRYRLSFSAKTSDASKTLRVENGSGNILLTPTLDTSFAVKTVEFTATSANISFIRQSTGDYNLWIDDVSIYAIGSIVSLRPKGINIPDTLTSAAQTGIVTGVAYEISTNFSAGEISTHGTDGLVGTRFVATTTGTLTTGRVKPIAVSTTTDAGWYGESTNALHGTVAGDATLEITTVEETFGDGIVNLTVPSKFLDASAGTNVGDTLLLPPRYFVTDCILQNYGTGSVTIKIGSTNGGGEYVSSKVLTAGQEVKFSVPDTLDPYSSTAFSPFYLSSASWGSGKVRAEFCLKRSSNTW